MRIKTGVIIVFAICMLVGSTSLMMAQQKGQYVPGQYGLNAGVTPDPGFTFASLTINYSADSLKDSNGNSVQGVTGNYSFWAVENIFYYVPAHKILGGKFFTMASLNLANGSLTADITPAQFGPQWRRRRHGGHLGAAGEPGLEFQASGRMGGLCFCRADRKIFSRSQQ